MKWSHIFLFVLAVAASTGRYVWHPFPPGSENPVVALMALDAPMLLWLLHGWYAAMPGTVVFIGGTLVLGVWRVWLEPAPRKPGGRGGLPPWPISETDEKPAIVVGETHHPVEAREVPNPDWLVIPEKGLYTGVAIFGAVGSGKTSACMHPFARQLLGWQAWNPERRAAALVLEVKGDFCYDIREILKAAKREEDYMEIGMDGKYQWNPLGAHWLDSYSLAYTVSSLLNQLFGKGKDPFWQQAYTNLVQWIIELYRIFPDRWVTLRDVYRCAIDPELFQQKLDEAKGVVKTQMQGAIVISAKDLDKRRAALGGVPWTPFSDGERQTPWTAELAKWLQREGVAHRVAPVAAHTGTDRLRARYESVRTWYEKDWMKLDPKLRTSCVEGISSFLSLFDMADVADIFCPKAPAKERAAEGEDAGNGDSRPPVGKARMRRLLPPLDELIESGKVLALNMPAGSNPALARAIGVFLKNAWLQTLLRRPAQMKQEPEALLPARRFHLRRISVVRIRWRGGPLRRREGVCPHPAVPRYPHRRHPIHILAPIRPGHLRGVAGALADAPHPDLPLPQRRRKRRARLETLRAGGQDQAELDRHRIRTTGPGVPALGTGRREPGFGRNQQILPRTARGFVSAQGVWPASQLPGDLPAL